MFGEEHWILGISRGSQFDGLSSFAGDDLRNPQSRLLFGEIPINAVSNGVGLSGCRNIGTGCGRSAMNVFKVQIHEPLWQPTRLRSPYCVLSANGVQDDFYTSSLSWGREGVVLALRDEVLLFQPSRPAKRPAVLNIQKRGRGSLSRVTSVSMSRFSDNCCFLGELDGSVALYESRGDGLLSPTNHFTMPPSLLEKTPLYGPPAMAATASVRCMTTSAEHPWMAAAGTAAQGLFMLDSRCTKPAAQMGGCDLPFSCNDRKLDSLPLPPEDAVSLLSSATGISGIAWNASGSLVATGRSDGIIDIWSLSQTRTPVMQTKLPSSHISVKAIAFHPTNPYELTVGGGSNDGILRVYDVSSAVPQLTWSVSTQCQVTQALYSPDGTFIVSAQGTQLKGSSLSTPPTRYFPPSSRLHTRRTTSSTDGNNESPYEMVDHLERLTERIERDMSGESRTHRESDERLTVYNSLKRETPSIDATSPFSLVVWRRGTQHRGSTSLGFTSNSPSSNQLGSYAKESPRHPPLPLVSMYTMSGHRSRPLQLSAPFAQAASEGCIASIAGDIDSTIRFWRPFCLKSEGATWEQRSRTSLRAAVTDQDVEDMMTVPLR
ncbi:WD40 repeat [Trypanosoma melophagium]|uniref:WD40 repeat n=1 Tax=Trypanosoma melophagium TaxID=715481 RepID=UPI00351A37A8|nr:WD40 repeat [Trypanosoma melophagium]